MPNLIDLSGKRFGRLTVLSKELPSIVRSVRWVCRCDCGIELSVLSQSLRRGQTRSCGCLHREQLGSIKMTHGMSYSFEYRVWTGMRSRCLNPRTQRYKDYGGRGITICDRWADSFENFFSDMGAAPGTKYSIDRIDNNAGYSPGNCRWATNAQQSRNQSRNRNLTCFGETRCLKDWSDKTGILVATIRKRLSLGWSINKALSTPAGTSKP